jgi:hypothetical protein
VEQGAVHEAEIVKIQLCKKLVTVVPCLMFRRDLVLPILANENRYLFLPPGKLLLAITEAIYMSVSYI